LWKPHKTCGSEAAGNATRANYASKPTKATHYNLTAEKASFALWLAFDSPWLAPIKY